MTTTSFTQYKELTLNKLYILLLPFYRGTATGRLDGEGSSRSLFSQNLCSFLHVKEIFIFFVGHNTAQKLFRSLLVILEGSWNCGSCSMYSCKWLVFNLRSLYYIWKTTIFFPICWFYLSLFFIFVSQGESLILVGYPRKHIVW